MATVSGMYARLKCVGAVCECGKSQYDFALARRFYQALRHVNDTALIAPPKQVCPYCLTELSVKFEEE